MRPGETVWVCPPNGSRKAVGKLVQDGDGNLWCRMYRERRRHFMRRLGAWGVDRKLLHRLFQQGVVGIVLVVQDEGRAYRAPIARLLREGQKADYGHGEQVFLPERFWDAAQHQQPAQLTFPELLGVRN